MSGHTANRRTIAVALVAAGAAAYGLRFAVAWILDGIVYLIWFVEALPQVLVWFTVLALLIVVTLRLVPARKRRDFRAALPLDGRRSDLLEVADQIRQAEFSPLARWVLRQRLGHAAASLRVKREAILSGQAWDDIEKGRWPAHPDLQAVLRPERGRARLVPHRGFAQQLERALGALWSYARGGDLDGS